MTYSRQLFLLILLSLGIPLLLRCSPKLASRGPEIIEVKYERINLKPLSGLELLDSFDGWPQDKQTRDFLLQELTSVWKTLLAEFRRCEKYGLYTIVDSTSSSTVTISPRITSIKMKQDTLFIPIEFKTLNISQKKVKIMTVNTFGIPAQSDTTTRQKLSIALSDYRRRFPYKETVALFYTTNSSEN